MNRSLDCPRCSGRMEAGFIIDDSHTSKAVSKWVAGVAEKSIWTGLKLRGRHQMDITTYRCRRCGYLESYA